MCSTPSLAKLALQDIKKDLRVPERGKFSASSFRERVNEHPHEGFGHLYVSGTEGLLYRHFSSLWIFIDRR